MTAAVLVTPGRAAPRRSPGEAGLERDVREAVAEPGNDPIDFRIRLGF